MQLILNLFNICRRTASLLRQGWQSIISLLQKDSFLTLKVCRPPALAVLPEFGIAPEILWRPTKFFEFVLAVDFVLEHFGFCDTNPSVASYSPTAQLASTGAASLEKQH